jgi:hypothetical protein
VRLLREGWLAQLAPDAASVLLLLALAADRQGASFYGRDRMALALGLSRDAVDRALRRLLSLGLVAHRPWRPGLLDGVWQLLPLPPPPPPRGKAEPLPVADILARMGLARPGDPPRPSK